MPSDSDADGLSRRRGLANVKGLVIKVVQHIDTASSAADGPASVFVAELAANLICPDPLRLHDDCFAVAARRSFNSTQLSDA